MRYFHRSWENLLRFHVLLHLNFLFLSLFTFCVLFSFRSLPFIFRSNKTIMRPQKLSQTSSTCRFSTLFACELVLSFCAREMNATKKSINKMECKFRQTNGTSKNSECNHYEGSTNGACQAPRVKLELRIVVVLFRPECHHRQQTDRASLQ